MALKLSILIATMPHRASQYAKLRSILDPQLTDEVEVLVDMSPKINCNIGRKRNLLLSKANGVYVVYIDDDDKISGEYVKVILNAIETNPDCVGISGVITTNGGNHRQWHISMKYGRWHELNSIYYRTPNHISPVKRELALKAGFPNIDFGEDHEYSKRLLPLLKTEVVIPGNIYHYDYWQKKSDS